MKPNIWDFVRNADGTYAILNKGKKIRDHIPERWLEDEVCGKYGFCGREWRDIWDGLSKEGKFTIVL